MTAEMTLLQVETERAWQALGQVSYGPTETEKIDSVQSLALCGARHQSGDCLLELRA